MIANSVLAAPSSMLTAVEILDPRAAGPSGAAGWYRHVAPQLDVWAGDGLVAGARPDVTVAGLQVSHLGLPGHLVSSVSLVAATTDRSDVPEPNRGDGGRLPLGRFRARVELEVRARTYSGSRSAAGEIIRWVGQLSECCCTTWAESDGWVVEVHDPDNGCLELNPGHVLVWTRSTRRWAVCSPGQFGAWFEPTPRELPVFSDGEVVE